MKKIVLGTLVVALAGWILFPAVGLTTVDMAKKEGNAACTKCHEAGKMTKEGLNAVGKCYLEKKDFKACETAK